MKFSAYDIGCAVLAAAILCAPAVVMAVGVLLLVPHATATPINLTANNETVEYSGYLPLDLPGTAISTGAQSDGRTFLNANNHERIRQQGNITQISMHLIVPAPGERLTNVSLEIWNGALTSANRLSSENVRSNLTNGTTSTATLASKVSVVEGNYVSLRVNGTVTALNFIDATAASENSLYYFNGYRNSPFNFSESSKLAYSAPVKLYGYPAPVFVGIGDSIMAGHPYHYSYIEDSLTSSPTKQILHKLSLLESNASYQNMGIGGQKTSQIRARYNTDVVALKPKVVIIEGGVNDLAAGTITEADYISNITYMIDTAISNDIYPIVIEILPWTSGTNAQMQKRDAWTSHLRSTIAEDYPCSAKLVNADSYVGQYRAGGDAGNLWDIKTEYNADGVHFTETGNEQIALAIFDAIESECTVPDTISYGVREFNPPSPDSLVGTFKLWIKEFLKDALA